MRRKLICSFALLSVLLVLSATLGSNPARAADYTKVGVNLGATANYTYSQTWSAVNKMHLYVYGVVGSIVTLNRTLYNPGGSVNLTEVLQDDVLIGMLLINYVIAANLQPHDPIYSGAAITINDTVTRGVAGSSRPQNHVALTNYWGLGWRVDWYWDQETGLITEMEFWLIAWFNFTMTSTTAWSASNFFTLPNLIILGEAAIIVVLLIMLLLRRRRK
ncbi:MAG: hypothetical protein WED04_10220 [Promethearchaeati archaeon SRVP18_Atabeyarchaeia-1]